MQAHKAMESVLSEESHHLIEKGGGYQGAISSLVGNMIVEMNYPTLL